MQALCRGRQPRSEAVLCPVCRSEQNNAGALHKEHAQITVSALCDAAEDSTITRRHLFWHQAKPCGKITPLRKGSAIANRSYHCASDDRPKARNSHQPPTALVGARQRFDLTCYSFDPLIEIFPVGHELPDDPDHTRREHIGTRSQDLWQLLSQEAKSLPHRNAVLQ